MSQLEKQRETPLLQKSIRMKMPLTTTLIRVYCLGKTMHPGLSLNHLKHQAILMIRTLAFCSDIRKWYAISDNPLLTDSLKRYPLISGAMYWPYINHSWQMKRKLAAIDLHYRSAPPTVVAIKFWINWQLISKIAVPVTH